MGDAIDKCERRIIRIKITQLVHKCRLVGDRASKQRIAYMQNIIVCFTMLCVYKNTYIEYVVLILYVIKSCVGATPERWQTVWSGKRIFALLFSNFICTKQSVVFVYYASLIYIRQIF